MKLIIYLVTIFALTAARQARSSRRLIRLKDNRIVGGQSTTIDKFPYQVSLREEGWHFCGGSIYRSNIIITASHCLEDPPLDSFGVVAGHTHISDGGNGIPVKKYILHPQYDPDELDYDVAIIMLAYGLDFSNNVQPIQLAMPNKIIRAGLRARVSGWGDTEENGSIAPDQLQYVNVLTIERERCAELYQKGSDKANITERMLCAGEDFGGKDACQGDSGGPLVIENRLIGIVSWGYGCARPEYPGVYTNVAVLRGWINETVNELLSVTYIVLKI